MGYLPQALVNYLALLGWGDGTENEFFTMDQLVEKFTIERVNKSGAIFNNTKLSSEAKPLLEDGFSNVATNLIEAYDNGELMAALEEGPAGWQKWVKSFGKSIKGKGKGLFMPLRVLLTGKLHGPDMGASIILLHKAGTTTILNPQFEFLTLDERFKLLKGINWDTFNVDASIVEPAATVH